MLYVSRSTTGASAEISVYLPNGEQVNSITQKSHTESTRPFCGVTVDDGGNVFAIFSHFSQPEENWVDEFQPLEWATNPAQEPAPTATISPNGVINSCKSAVDSNKTLAIKEGTGSTTTGEVFRVPGASFGPPEEPFSLGVATKFNLLDDARDVASDLSNDHFYVTENGEVHRFDPSDTRLEHFGGAQLSSSAQGIAVDSVTGTVFVSDFSADEVFVFKEYDAPLPTLDAASEVLQFTADLSGEVDPDGAGEVTGCEFEYVSHATFLATEFEEATAIGCDQATPYASAQAVSASIGGLSTETEYHFRLAAENAAVTNYTEPQTFVTHAVQDLQTDEASNVGPREAELNASFTGINEDTDYYFQYGETTNYDQATPLENAGETTGPTPISTELEELELETTYHYRVVAENSSGTTFGNDMTFTTHPAVAGVVTTAATGIGQDGVTLNGGFEGNGLQTSYYFEYGPTTEYGLLSEPAPGTDAGTPVGPTPVSSVISEYEGYTTYHYRLVAVNSFGEARGPDETFTTLPAPLPDVSAPNAGNVTPTSAMLSAQVNPNRWPTTYLFEWGPTTSYGSSTVLGEVIGGLDNLDHQVATAVDGLTPATLYHFRVVALNFTGTTNGPDHTFITPGAPTVESTFASAVGQTTARLGARVAGNAMPTNVHFEYGTSTAYGGVTGAVPVGSELVANEAVADIGGLASGTTYHFRAVATNGIGTTFGPDQVLTTAAAPAASTTPKNCGNLARRAKRNSNRAKKLRRKAGKSASTKRSRLLRMRAGAAAKRARRLSRQAKACRRGSA